MTKRKAPNTTHSGEPLLKARHRQLEAKVRPEESFQSSPNSILSLGTVLDTSLRVLRAVEEIGITDGDIVQMREDFPVPACFLNVSEVLAPLADEDEPVLRSDDNVIQMHDHIESVHMLVDWLTRKSGFTFNKKNFPIFVHLADKYDIESLHQDLVHYSFRIMYEICTKKGAQEEPDEEEYKLWKLPAI